MVEELAILVAGRAPYEDGDYMNLYVPKCVVSSDYETTMMLAEASKSPITFSALDADTLEAYLIEATGPIP